MNQEIIKPEVGMKVTVCGYSDRKVFDLIKITPSGKTITLREREPVLIKKPVMVPGGFAGIVTEPAVWETKENLKGHIKKASLRKDGTWKTSGGNSRCILNLDSYHYDYGF